MTDTHGIPKTLTFLPKDRDGALRAITEMLYARVSGVVSMASATKADTYDDGYDAGYDDALECRVLDELEFLRELLDVIERS